jgi:hypothetical protein
MSPLVALTIAAWVWISLAAAAIIVSTIIVISSFVEEEWLWMAPGLLTLVASSGFLFSSLYMTGYSSPAFWSWRITGGFTVITGIVCVVKSFTDTDFGLNARVRLAVAGVTIFSVLPLICSIFATPVPAISRPLQTGLGERVVIVSGVALWHNIALVVIGIGTAMFLVLFVRAVGRGIAPGIESHWGGLGGGLSGWQISLSLTYFIGCVMFGVLFSLLALRGDNAAAGTEIKASAPGQTTSTTQPKTVPQPSAATPATSDAQTGAAADSQTTGK